MAVHADRVKEVSTTTGTGTYSLAGAATGFQAFSDAFSTADTVYYCAEDGTNWEVGLGTLTTGAPWTLARTSILASSNADAAVNWAAGTRNIFCTLPASVATGFGVAGSDTQVMFNDGGAFGGDAGLTYNKTTDVLSVTGGITLGTSGNLVGGTNTVELRNGTNAQTFNLYNTYTDASNYERGFMRFASNVLEIGAEAAGTGTGRALKFYTENSKTFGITASTTVMTLTASTGTVTLASTSTSVLNLAPATINLCSSTNLTITSTGFQLGRSQTYAFRIGALDAVSDVNVAANSLTIAGANAFATAATNLDGQSIYFVGGAGASGSAGDADGGHIYLDGGRGYGTGDHGGIYFAATRGRISYFNVTPVAQQSGTGETTGFTAGAGTAVLDDSTFTGNVGSTAYRISDVVKALKNYGLLAA